MNPTRSTNQLSEVTSNGTISEDGNWSVVTNNFRNRDNNSNRNFNNQNRNFNNQNRNVNNQNTNTQNTFRICKFYAEGRCKNSNKKSCTQGFHLSEKERNMDERVKICYSYDNSPYFHDILDCVKLNNGLCNHCAFGSCQNTNQCLYRHDPNSRYKKHMQSKSDSNFAQNVAKQFTQYYNAQYFACSKWIAKLWCDGKCRSQHRGQCPDEFELCKEGKTCPPDCSKGIHQGPKPQTDKVDDIGEPNIPLCVEIAPVPIYSMGSKPKPPIRIKKVKKNTEDDNVYYVNDEKGNEMECVKIDSSPIIKSNSHASINSVKSNNSKKSTMPKEILGTLEDLCGSNQIEFSQPVILCPNQLKLNMKGMTCPPECQMGLHIDSTKILKSKSMQSIYSELTMESCDKESSLKYKESQSISPAPSPLNVKFALETTTMLNELAEMSRIESPATIMSNSYVSKSSSKKKLSIIERQREKREMKKKEREKRRPNRVEDSSDDESDGENKDNDDDSDSIGFW